MIYLDHNATAPLDPGVLDAMLPWLRDRCGNPASSHPAGLRALGALDVAREQVADLLGCSPGELVFTSGATESIHHALRGARRTGRPRIVTTAVEHRAVLGACEAPVTRLTVDREGCLDLDLLAASLMEDTGLVSIQAANPETGVIQPLEAIAPIVKATGALLHVDAAQAAGKLPLDLEALPIDLLSLSAHKFGGPMGAGALFIRRGTKVRPLLPGTQEQSRRGGTENVPGIVGLGAAAERCRALMGRWAEVAARRDRFEARVLAGIPDSHVNGARTPRLANTSSLAFAGLDGEELHLELGRRGVCVSTGSACAAGEPSHVLEAMGTPHRKGAIRVSLGLDTTQDELLRTLEILRDLVPRLRR